MRRRNSVVLWSSLSLSLCYGMANAGTLEQGGQPGFEEEPEQLAYELASQQGGANAPTGKIPGDQAGQAGMGDQGMQGQGGQIEMQGQGGQIEQEGMGGPLGKNPNPQAGQEGLAGPTGKEPPPLEQQPFAEQGGKLPGQAPAQGELPGQPGKIPYEQAGQGPQQPGKIPYEQAGQDQLGGQPGGLAPMGQPGNLGQPSFGGAEGQPAMGASYQPMQPMQPMGQPSYGMPSQPMGQPMGQPSYGMPSQPMGQPSYGAPYQPGYPSPYEPSYQPGSQPGYGGYSAGYYGRGYRSGYSGYYGGGYQPGYGSGSFRGGYQPGYGSRHYHGRGYRSGHYRSRNMFERTYDRWIGGRHGHRFNFNSADTMLSSLEGSEGKVALQASTQEPFGAYLTDGQGRSLYLFMADNVLASNCYDECAKAWPPLLVSNRQQVEANAQLDRDLISVIERADGKLQVAYHGWPLYYYVKDQKPGDTKGQNIGDENAKWYLISPEGEKITTTR